MTATPYSMIVSTGNQDLKIFFKRKKANEEIIELREIGRKGRRQLHQMLIDGKIPYQTTTNEDELKEAIGSTITIPAEWRNSKGWADINIEADTIDQNKPFKADDRNNAEPLTNKNNELLLFPAKLHTVINSIKATDDICIIGGLVFYTDRKKNNSNIKKLNEQYNQEPIATGKLIAEWLEAQFPDSHFTPINFMQGLYAFEGNHVVEHQSLAPYDQPIALKATHIIGKAIQENKKQLTDSHPNIRAILSHTGGIADAKAIITSATRLYFNNEVIELHDSEHIPDDPVCLQEANRKKCQILPRNTILDAKSQATQRIWEGDFAGAWSVVAHIEEDDPELKCDTWVNKVYEAASFMEGWESYENNSMNPFDQSTIDKGLDKLLWLAFKTEASLQHNKGKPLISETLRWICTFREKALEYLILVNLKKSPPEDDIHVNIKTWTLTKENGNKISIENQELKVENPMYIAFPKSENILKNLSCSNYCAYNNLAELIDTNTNTMQRERRARKSIRYYRNKLTHHLLPAEKIEKIEKYGNDNGLWMTDKNLHNPENLGTTFLDMDTTKKLFAVIDPSIDPASIYRCMVTTLLDIVTAPIPENC